MGSPIITRAAIRAKARAAFNRGAGRDGHGFNWHAQAAISTWQHEWDLCSAERSRKTGNQVQLAGTPP